jgi:hypothetical protein
MTDFIYVDVYDDDDDNLAGQRKVSANKLNGYITRAREKFGYYLSESDFAFIGGDLCIDSKLPEDFFEDLAEL